MLGSQLHPLVPGMATASNGRWATLVGWIADPAFE